MVYDCFKDLLKTLISNPIELESERKELCLLLQKDTEFINRLIIYLIVIQVQFLDGGAVIKGLCDGLDTLVANTVVLYAYLDKLTLSLEPVISNFNGTSLS